MNKLRFFTYLLFTVNLLSCNSDAQQSKMIINLKLINEEISKDSNTETISIQVYSNKVVYNSAYSGFRAPEEKKRKFRINAKELEIIIKEFESLGLNKNLTEIKPTKDIGVNGYLKIEFNGPPKTILNIEGKKSIWGADDYIEKNWGQEFVKKRTNIVNYEYFDKATQFVNSIKAL